MDGHAKQMRHCLLILMLYCPSRSPVSASSRLLGSWARSRNVVAASRIRSRFSACYRKGSNCCTCSPSAKRCVFLSLYLWIIDHFVKNTLDIQGKYSEVFSPWSRIRLKKAGKIGGLSCCLPVAAEGVRLNCVQSSCFTSARLCVGRSRNAPSAKGL